MEKHYIKKSSLSLIAATKEAWGKNWGEIFICETIFDTSTKLNKDNRDIELPELMWTYVEVCEPPVCVNSTLTFNLVWTNHNLDLGCGLPYIANAKKYAVSADTDLQSINLKLSEIA